MDMGEDKRSGRKQMAAGEAQQNALRNDNGDTKTHQVKRRFAAVPPYTYFGVAKLVPVTDHPR